MQPVHEFRSETSETVIYVCGGCGLTATGEGYATECCVCPGCGKDQPKRYRNLCEDCRKADHEKRVVERKAKEAALTVVEDTGTPVYHAGSDQYYGSLQDAIDVLVDDGEDLDAAVLHPCDVRQVHTPDLEEHVIETWGEEFDNDGYEVELSKEASEACKALQEMLQRQAPSVWYARTNERLSLPGPGPGPLGRSGVRGG